MRILLIGERGQLGWELCRTLAPLGTLQSCDVPTFNLADLEQVRSMVRNTAPQVIVNAAAYTAVDQAESEREAALAVNNRGPEALAREAKRLGAVFIHYSTDYVFDGVKGSPYTENDQPNPINVYGESKLAGEYAIQAVGGAYLILRTSWVYSLRRESFVTKVLGWARQHPTLRVVDDQVGSPTWSRMLAEVTALLLARIGEETFDWVRARRGVYHLGGSGHASRLDWARAILAHDPHPEEQVVEAVLPAKSDEFPTPAARPLYSALDCTRFETTFGLRLPPWEVALRMALEGGS